MQHRRPRTFLLAALAASLGPACGPSSASEGPAQASLAGGVRQREIPKVRVAPVRRLEMVQELETTSVLESEREIRLFPRISGTVVEVLAEEGQPVAAGDVLARLDDRDEVLAARDAEVALAERENDAKIARLAVEEAEGLWASAKLASAQRERDWNRNVKLYEESETKPLSRQEIEASRLELDRARGDEEQAEVTLRRRRLEADAAETAVARARVTLERARLALAYTRIVAPFEGVVAERAVRVGDMVGSAQPTFVLTDPEAIRAVFHRPQEELELFVRGGSDGSGELAFRATTEAYPGRDFAGTIERISPTIDAASGQFRVTARLHPPADGGPPLLPGMLVRMHIVTDRHAEALVVPKRALRRAGERRFLLAVEEAAEGQDGQHVLREVAVREGFSDDERVEVVPLEGAVLEPGTRVVVVGGRELAAGEPVDVDAAADLARGDDEEE